MDDVDKTDQLKTLAAVVYGLQAAGFIVGLTWIVAVVINYVKKDDVAGTWLESHFRWQIRTFWFGAFWVCLCGLFIVMTFGIGLIVAWLPLGLVSVWFIYRVARGWLALQDARPMYT